MAKQGWTVSVEGGASLSEPVRATRDGVPDPVAPELGELDLLALASVRGGWHAAFGGLELGPAIVMGDGELVPFFSAEAWAGLPVLHAAANLLSGPTPAFVIPLSAGLGHSGRWTRAELALMPTTDDGVAVRAGAALAPTEHLWLGAEAFLAAESEWSALGTLSIRMPQ